MFVVATTLNVRAGPSASATLLGKLARGGQLLAVDAASGWIAIRLENGALGWVDSRYVADTAPPVIAEIEPEPPASEPPARPAYDRNQVVQAIIRASIAGYSGRCPCPYNTMKNGRSCGGNSAYLRAGGEAPLCFARDVTQAMIDNWVARQR